MINPFPWKQFLDDLLSKMGFGDRAVEIEEEHRHARIFVYNQTEQFEKGSIPMMIDALNHLVQVIAQKQEAQPVFVDVNNYRKEREKLLTELARAAARKAASTKESIVLPAMNSYERRIIHAELSMRPDVTTESQGIGRQRHVIVKSVGQGT